jgi:hypothetical protein
LSLSQSCSKQHVTIQPTARNISQQHDAFLSPTISLTPGGSMYPFTVSPDSPNSGHRIHFKLPSWAEFNSEYSRQLHVHNKRVRKRLASRIWKSKTLFEDTRRSQRPQIKISRTFLKNKKKGFPRNPAAWHVTVWSDKRQTIPIDVQLSEQIYECCQPSNTKTSYTYLHMRSCSLSMGQRSFEIHENSMDLRTYWCKYRMSEPEFNILDTLQLACTLCDAFISCLGTPMLTSNWNLSNFAVFTCQWGNLTATLDSLHINFPISDKNIAVISRTLDTVENDCSNRKETVVGFQEAELVKYLGVALLEIELGPSSQDMETVKNEIFDSSSPLLYLENPLGPLYRKITRRCLDFDIGCNKDCSISLLKATLHDEVNCVLHHMFQYISE